CGGAARRRQKRGWTLLHQSIPIRCSQRSRVDHDRSREVATDDKRPKYVRLKTPQPAVDANTLRFEISDHRGRPRSLKRRPALSAVEDHDPDHAGSWPVLPPYPKV